MFIKSHDQRQHIDALAITYLSNTEDVNEAGRYYVDAYASSMDLWIRLLERATEEEADALIRKIESFKDNASSQQPKPR